MLGPAAVLAYLLCAVLIGLVGLCFAEVGSRVTGAGGLYAYATEAFGPVVGGIAGTLLWVANSVAANAAVASLLVDTLTVATPGLSVGIARTTAVIAIYALLAAVNIVGARSGARLSIVLAIIKLVPLVLLIAVGAFGVHWANLHWLDIPPASNVGRTAVLLFFAFMGVEGSLSASGEVSNPARTIPRAIFMTLIVVAFLYIGLQLVAQGVLGGELSGAPTPLVLVATRVLGPWGTRAFVATTALSAAGFLSADMLCSPRNVHALAERGQLPAWLAPVSDRFRTPAVAVAAYSIVCALVALSGSFRQLVVVSSSGTLVVYLICCLAVFPLRARNVAVSGPPFRAPGGPFVPIAASAIILWMLSTLPWQELAAAALLVAIAGAGYTFQARYKLTVSKRSAVVPGRI
jgi:amino acid transporter